MARKNHLYKAVYNYDNLRKAWTKIHSNGLRSSSDETQKSVEIYKNNEHQNIKLLRKKLRQKTLSFSGVKGVSAKKKSGDRRPLVNAPVELRIVQRCALDTLIRRTQINKYFKVKSSFGAIPKKGVPDAIRAVVQAIKSGAKFYIKSDIPDFFANIPRKSIVDEISKTFNDDNFSELLDKITNLEIENLDQLEKKYGTSFKQLFVFEETGTPQGCCLSPLLGNMVLYNFDLMMNSKDITCLRYLDDFLILGPSLKDVKGAFSKGQRLLADVNLTAYTIENNPQKACQGKIEAGFEFLGIEFSKNFIRPSKEARQVFLKSIDETFKNSLKVDFALVGDSETEKYSMARTIYHVSNKIKGWGNQYKLCDDKSIRGSLDHEIDILLMNYLNAYYKMQRKLNPQQRRRQIGLHLLKDCKIEAINSDQF